ncbi:hypothetical protein [uncultured Methanoregula sp.]|uniref:hypothetical protein n=1 Tax=uncultured Methanoregula sp. TaxID=1005933 RepID=UPI002AAB9D51|nr:hypothetical protein [uncultured Methanoregula sp.]
MTACAAGQILCGNDGRMHVRIWGERYYLIPEDLGLLFFVGDPVPLRKTGPSPEVHEVSGTVSLNPSGQAVVIATGRQRYMLPREQFLAVAFGEEISCTFFEAPSGGSGIEEIFPKQRGAAP